MIIVALKIAVLSENTALNNRFKSENGMSIWVEDTDVRLIFDFGNYSGAMVHNSEELGIDLSTATHMAFSHNHFDHCGGFFEFSQRYKLRVPLYAGNGFFTPKYWDHSADGDAAEMTYQPVGPGISVSDVLRRHIGEFKMINTDVFRIGQSRVYLVGNFPRAQDPEKIHPSSVMEKGGRIQIDEFPDEQVCVIDTDKGLVVLTGCAHSGVVNIVETIKKRFGKEIYAIIGGTHLITDDPYRIDFTVKYFSKEKTPLVGACHCTGEMGLAAFAHGCAGFIKINAGMEIEI